MNDIFLEKEENSVIKLERLEDAAASAVTLGDLKEVYSQFVDFHGEVRHLR